MIAKKLSLAESEVPVYDSDDQPSAIKERVSE